MIAPFSAELLGKMKHCERLNPFNTDFQRLAIGKLFQVPIAGTDRRMLRTVGT